MSWESARFRLVGTSPLLLHNGQLADPLSSATKALKQITSKRQKTDADHEEIARREWYGSLYVEDGRVIIPADVIAAMIIDGAKKRKRGPAARAGVVVDMPSLLEHDGPSDVDALWSGRKHVLTCGVRNQKNRVMRTRPLFRRWAVAIEAQFDETQIDASELREIIEVAGRQCGIGDWRPRFGRFEVEAA